MRILTEKETQYLNGDIFSSGISDKVAVYTLTGIPSVYRTVDSSSDNMAFVTIPSETLHSYRQQLLVASDGHKNHVISVDPIEAENSYFKLLFVDGELPFLFSAEKAEYLQFSKNELESIAEAVAFYRSLNITDLADNLSIMQEFIGTLFDPNGDVNGFIKRFIKLIGKYVDEGCGAYYYRDNNLYKLRMVVGDIAGFESFPGLLEQSKIDLINKELARGNHFIPVEMWQQEIVFSKTPPLYHFTAKGIQSDTTEYLFFYTVDARLTETQAKALKLLSDLATMLHEHSFIGTAGMLETVTATFNENRDPVESTGPFIRHLFLQLHQQLGAQYCVLTDMKAGTHACFVSPDTTLQYNYQDQFWGLSHHTEAGNGLCYVTSDDDNSTLRKSLPKTSHECLIPLPKDSGFLIGLNSDYSDYENLNDYFKTVSAVVKTYYGLFLSKQNQLSDDTVIPAQHSTDETIPWNLYNSLSNGYFTQLQEFGTVMINQLELVNKIIQSNHDSSEPAEKLYRHMSQLSRSADEINYLVESLKNIIPSGSLDKQITGKKFLRDLPGYLRGVLYTIKERKNITVRLEMDGGAGSDFTSSAKGYFTVVLPLIVKVLENMISHCALRVSLKTYHNQPAILFSCPLDVLATSDPRTLFGAIVHNGQVVSSGDVENQLEIGGLYCGWEVTVENELCVWFTPCEKHYDQLHEVTTMEIQ